MARGLAVGVIGVETGRGDKLVARGVAKIVNPIEVEGVAGVVVRYTARGVASGVARAVARGVGVGVILGGVAGYVV